MTERSQMCRGPENRAWNKDDRRNALDADGVTHTEQVRERGEPAFTVS